MARRALAAIALACGIPALLASGCGLADGGPAAGEPTPPLVTHPWQGPSGTPTDPGSTRAAPPEGTCGDAEDVTAALGAAGRNRRSAPAEAPIPSVDPATRPVQIVPRCSELEVPVPFTVPHADERPGRV